MSNEKPTYRQKEYKREGREIHTTADIHDTKNFEMGNYWLQETDSGTWRIGRGKKANAKRYVEVPGYIGKLVRNAVVAQGREHDSMYSYLSTDIQEGTVPLVPAVLREVNCNSLAMQAVGMHKPDLKQPLTLRRKEFDAREQSYDRLGGFSTLRIRHNTENSFDILHEHVRAFKNKCPLVGRIRRIRSDGTPEASVTHSFLVLGVLDDEIICFEKMGFKSLPFRIGGLEEIAEDYYAKYEGDEYQWEFAGVDELAGQVS